MKLLKECINCKPCSEADAIEFICSHLPTQEEIYQKILQINPNVEDCHKVAAVEKLREAVRCYMECLAEDFGLSAIETADCLEQVVQDLQVEGFDDPDLAAVFIIDPEGQDVEEVLIQESIEEPEMDLDTFLRDAEVLLVDNARTFNINQWEAETAAEEAAELDEVVDSKVGAGCKFVKYKLNDEDIDRIIEKLKTSSFTITDYWKTKQFLKKNNLQKEDLEEVVRNLSREDYKANSRSLDSENCSEASIFIKKSKIKDLGPFDLYIELDYDSIESNPVIVISFHSRSGSLREGTDQECWKSRCETSTGDSKQVVGMRDVALLQSDTAQRGDDYRVTLPDEILETIKKVVPEEFAEKPLTEGIESLSSFVELEGFRRDWKDLGLTEEDLRDLQNQILNQDGKIDPLGSLVYKIRFSPKSWNRGRDTSHKVIYIEVIKAGKIYLAAAFSKSDEANISSQALDMLRSVAKNLNRG